MSDAIDKQPLDKLMLQKLPDVPKVLQSWPARSKNACRCRQFCRFMKRHRRSLPMIVSHNRVEDDNHCCFYEALNRFRL